MHRLLLSAAALYHLPGTAVAAPQPSTPTLTSLSAAIGSSVRDTNGDDLPDVVTAQVIVPAQPSLRDVQAAANIAGRLGYETTAATLSFVVKDDARRQASSLPILVGRQNRFVRDLVASGRLDLSKLAPGQGLVALVPDAIGTSSAIVVVGVDDAGTAAASVELAARLPRLWNMTGIALPAIEAQTVAFLQQHELRSASAAVTRIVVDNDRRGIAVVGLQVTVAPDQEAAAARALRDLDAAHRLGGQVGVLDFGPAAVLDFTVGTGPAAQTATVHRVGPNWRALTAPPPTPVRTAGVAPSRSNGRRMNFYRAFHDGMTPGGGGTSYGMPAPPAVGKPFDLADAYTIDGWFGDLYQDLTPDSTETSVILGGDAIAALGAANIAARLGLESTGITLPIAKLDADVAQPDTEPSPILVGRDNLLVGDLVAAGKLGQVDAAPGLGVIEIVPRAFGAATATVVRGADAAGTAAAAEHLSRRLPYLWDMRPGAPTFADARAQATDFFAARTPAGQAARAVQAAQAIAAEIGSGAAAGKVDATVYLDGPDAGLSTYLAGAMRKALPGTSVAVTAQAVSDPVNVFDEAVTLGWEGDAVRAALRTEVLPKVKPGASVTLELRVNEGPEIRAQLAKEAQAQLSQAGAAHAEVKVRSAYKQGYFWLVEDVLPQLKARGVTGVRIKVRAARHNPSATARFQAMPTQWIKALYPADEAFHRELGMPIAAFAIEQVEDAPTIYALEATDASGRVVYSASFDPSVVDREFLEALPGYAKLEAETGHIHASVNDAVVLDRRLPTDLDTFWDHYQQQVLPRLRDTMKASAAASGPQPMYRDLKMSIAMSEPDYGIGEGEHISTLEGLSQDLYMITNTFLRQAGIAGGVRVIPLVEATATKPTRARFVLTRNAAAGSRIDVVYGSGAGRRTVSRPLDAVKVETPRVTRIVTGAEGVRELGLRVAVGDPGAATQAEQAVVALAGLHAAGLYRDALSFDHVDRVTLTVESSGAPARVASLVHVDGAKPSSPRKLAKAGGKPLVTYDHIIDPPEAEAIVGELGRYPGVAAYKAGASYEGRDISVLEITASTPSELVSTAKLSAYKPSLMLVGRQHGNEPSSTSYMLKLAEDLATDPAYRDIAAKVNVAILPVMNPDGAALAGKIRATRPYDIAQPGYLNAIGRDVMYSGMQSSEASVEPNLWRRWLPDIYLNAHGASSHEVVRPFSGYAATEAPTYSFRRGWYSLSFQMPRDPRYPEWTEAALALHDAMAREVSSDPVAHAGNLRDYDRFRRWGHRYGPHLEPMEVSGDTMLFYNDPDSGELLGNRRIGVSDADRQRKMGDWPFITLDGGTFEAADEGLADYSLDLAARNGFAAVLAHLKYLRDGQYHVDLIEEDAPLEGAKRTRLRVRPVLPPKK